MTVKSPYRIGAYPDGTQTTGEFIMTSSQGPRWGNFHNGYDLVGLPITSNWKNNADVDVRTGKYKYPQKMIYSTTPGVVYEAKKSGWNGGRGICIVIQSSTPGETDYFHHFMHLCKIADGIENGVKVDTGTLLGFEGSTGSSTGSHIHYEIRKGKPYLTPTSINSPDCVRLEEWTGIPNKEHQIYRTTDEAVIYVHPYGAYIQNNFYIPYVYTDGEWKKVIPKIYRNSKWNDCYK